MYTNITEKVLLEQSKKNLSIEIDANNFISLIECIEYADWKYYVNDNPILSDSEYDILFKKLKTFETQNPTLISKSSPTQRIANGLNKSFITVSHLVPMLSLENSYDANDLFEWDRKCKALSKETQIEYCVEPKFDGASISLIYENDYLIRGATRGNGTEGDDITTNTKQIRSIPLQAKLSAIGIKQLEIRGEVVITKKNFVAYNEKIITNGEQPLANARNAASGSLRIKDPSEVAKRNLDAFLYNVSFITKHENTVSHSQITTHLGLLQALSQCGFKTSYEHAKSFTNIEDVTTYIQEFEQNRDDLPYEIDGMVVKVNNIDFQERIGQTSHHPRWAIAFKFKARQATSKLLSVEYQVGRTGSITPVAKIEPVAVGGVTISSLSLFNEDVVKEKQMMIGDTILIERAGDVIPYVVKSFPELRNGTEKNITFPSNCPECDASLFKPEGEAIWRCTNYFCKAQVVERIIHFTSKDAMDIKGLGNALINKFYKEELLYTIDEIYKLPFEKMQNLEGFGEKSMLNLKLAIEKSKTQPLHRLLFGLGIRYVGETTAKAIARSISHVSELFTKSKESLLKIEDVGEKVANSVVEFFIQEDNRILLQNLENEGVCLSNLQKNEALSSSLIGKSFLFTGTLSMKRSDAEALAEKHGGNIVGSVSTKLNYLIVGEDAGSKLEKAKKIGTITILNETEFLAMLA
jgi:DNA ligase (NAD+)